MTESVARRRRDPETRRREIVAATAELIVEIGVSAVTHRLIAARAHVPLGATTQYFATLDDLRAEALQCLAADVEQRMAGIRQTLATEGATSAVLTRLLLQGLADARALEADRAVVTAAVDDPQLRELARHWSAQMADMLAPDHGPERAKAAAIFIDGVLWHARINAEPLTADFLQTTLSAILGESTPTPSTSD